MKQSTLEKYYNILLEIKTQNLTLTEYCKRNNCSRSSIYNTIRTLKENSDIESDMVKKILTLYYEITGTEVVCIEPITINSEVKYIRGEDDLIDRYDVTVAIKDKSPFHAVLSKEDVEKIFGLYTYYGGNITARQVANEFPLYTLADIKRIFRAFSLTKDSIFVPPHLLEVLSNEEIAQYRMNLKERAAFKYVDQRMERDFTNIIKKLAQENQELQKQLNDISKFEIILPEKINPIKIPEYELVGQSINLYLSDFHIGAYTTSGSLFTENASYGVEEAKKRLSKVLLKLRDFDCFDTINLVLMGDMVDCAGKTGFTARFDHLMPNNMDAREQGNKYIELILWFIASLIAEDNAIASKIRIFSVPEGNHDGNYGYMCNKALLAIINAKYPNIETTLWEQFYGKFEQNSHIFYISHGKESIYMKKPMPLLLDDKTKTLIYEWLMSQGETGDNIHIIKGDLHSNALTSCKKFDYRNVLSLFGASDYSNYNYSRNSWGVSYDLMIGDNLIRGTFENL